MYRFTLYNDVNGLSPWKQCAAKKIKTWSDISIYAFSQVVIDGVSYYKFHATFQGLQVEAGGGTENYMLYPDENVHGVRDTDFVTKYGADGDIGLSIDFNSSSDLDRVGVGYFAYNGQSIINSQVVLSGSVTTALRAYTLNYNGVDFVLFGGRMSNDPIYEMIGVSKNAFAPSTTPRFTPPTEPDPDGGYGTGVTPSGDQDGTVVNVDVGGDTVNVLPPSVTVGVEVNMPTTNEPQINHPAGINIALVSNSALGALNDALWGRNQNGFDDLWLQFKNYNYNPIQAIISCFKLPRWVISKVNETAAGTESSIGIGGTTIAGFTGKAVDRGATVRTSFETKPLTQFNTFQDFVGVTIRAFAPFVGWFDLEPSLCFGVSGDNSRCTVRFEYTVDVTNGNVGLVIWATTTGKGDTQAHETPIAMGSGNCAYPVLLASNDRGISDIVGGFTQMFGGVLSATAGFTSDNPLMAISGVASAVGGTASAMFPQQHTTTVGGVSGSVGYLGYLTPFVQVIKPRYAEPSQYTPVFGRPSYAGEKVEDFAGHWAQLEVHPDSIDFANKEDREIIADALADGVYV